MISIWQKWGIPWVKVPARVGLGLGFGLGLGLTTNVRRRSAEKFLMNSWQSGRIHDEHGRIHESSPAVVPFIRSFIENERPNLTTLQL